MSRLSVAVLGGGSFGTVLANIAAENGHASCLWLRDHENADAIIKDRVNAAYLPDYRLEESLRVTTDVETAVTGVDLILIAVPSKAFRETVRHFVPYLESHRVLVSTAKGVEEDGFKLMSQILQEECPQHRIGVLSGPNLAKEVAQRMLTATVIASEDENARSLVHHALANEYFRVYASNDMYGVELGGVLKNIYAIISGLASALGMGENTRSMLITRSLAEMSRFAVKMGANPLTFIGLAGVGDLIVTCMSPLSRNFRVGYALGKGESLDRAVSELGEVAEGVNTLRLVKQKSDELEVYMPLASVLYDVLYNKLSIEQAITLLMSGSQSSDVDFVLPREA